jgi:hypothetical protein
MEDERHAAITANQSGLCDMAAPPENPTTYCSVKKYVLPNVPGLVELPDPQETIYPATSAEA